MRTRVALLTAMLLAGSIGRAAAAPPTADTSAKARPSAQAPAGEAAADLTMDRAVAFALAHNRDVIAARLGIREAELAEVEAAIYPNPVLSYSVGNLVIGRGNPNNVALGESASPGFFSQTVHNVGISEIIDIWSKRGARRNAAERGTLLRRDEVADVLRHIVHEVRSAFLEVGREESERELRREMRARYAETLRLSRARRAAGEIAESDLQKLELEGMKYDRDAIAADAELDLARQKLAALLGLLSGAELPPSLRYEDPPNLELAAPALVAQAIERRPDVRAAEHARAYAEASLGSARREARPDLTLGLSYTHSEFIAAGDNPDSLGVGIALPLPIFDRNQANIGRADLAMQRAANERSRLEVVVNREVGEAVRRVERAQSLLALFEKGGTLERADRARQVAERSYQAGAISLLELLEAQRTFLETRADYLRATYDYRQSRVDLRLAMGSD
ncbi:MAG: TolC family protein [Polyangiaceae bacterium]